MRGLFAVLALLGVAGIVVGIVTIIRGTTARAAMPFRSRTMADRARSSPD